MLSITVRKVFFVTILCFVALILIFYRYQRLISYKAFLPGVREQQPRYSQFVAKEIRHVKGLVIEKNDQERILVLRQADEGELRTKLLPQANIAKVFWNEKGESVVVEGDFWQEITPLEIEVSGVCADQTCASLTALFINKRAGE